MTRFLIPVLALALVNVLPAAVLGGTMTVDGVSADDPLTGLPDGDLKVKVRANAGPSIGDCEVEAEAEASETDGDAGADCDNPGDASAGASGPVHVGPTVVTYTAGGGCDIFGSPTVTFTTQDDVVPQNDPSGVFAILLPSPQNLDQVRWLVTGADLDLNEITFTIPESCGGTLSTLSTTWTQRG